MNERDYDGEGHGEGNSRAAVSSDRRLVQQLSARVPRCHKHLILEWIADAESRIGHLREVVEQARSCNVLAPQIDNRAHQRQFNADRATYGSGLLKRPAKDEIRTLVVFRREG